MDDSELVARVQALRRTYFASVERQLVIDFQMVGKTYRVFLGNEAELRLLLERTSEMEVALKLWNIENRPAFEAFLDEVDRLLHNYLAAVGSLRDHTRALWAKHLPDDREYDERARETFTESGLCVFVQNLRNYTLHANLPIIQGHMSWERGKQITTGVQLRRPNLLKWKKWPAAGKRYLADLPQDGIDLAELVANYTDAVAEFNDWFGEAFVDRCAEAFARVREMEDEMNELVPGMFRAPTRGP